MEENKVYIEEERKAALDRLVALGLDAIKSNQGALLLLNSAGDALMFESIVSRRGLARHGQLFDPVIGKSVPVGQGVTGRAASERKPQWSSGLDPGSFHRVGGDGAPHSVLAVPVIHDGVLAGVMTAISFDRDREFSETAAQTYQEYAAIAAFILHC